MRKTLALFATSFILASSLLLVGSVLANSAPSISITPDTSVFVYGGDSVRIWILASDPDVGDTITVEKTYGIGAYDPQTELAPISDEFYFHPDTSGVYTFIFPVTDEDGATGADTTQVLVTAKKVDFRQSANDDSPYPTGDVHWIGSILQQSNSKYYEGMSTLQRIVFINIPKTVDSVHTLNFSHQANKGTTIHAYDFLTSWDQGKQAAYQIDSTLLVNLNHCGPEIGPPANLGAICESLHTSGFTATPDAPDAMDTLLGDDVASKVVFYEDQLDNRTVKIYGNTSISAASIAFNGYTGSTDKHADYTLTWTSSSDSIVIEMAGHLAAGIDPVGQPGVGYGAGRGAANIQGGPYHFKLYTLDGASLGSQDNQIKGADILLPPPVCSCTVEGEPCAEPCSVETHKDSIYFDFHATDAADGENMTATLQFADPPGPPANPPTLVIDVDQPGLLEGHFVWYPDCELDKSIWYHFEVKVTDGEGWDTCHYYAHCYNEPPWVNCPPNVEIHGDHAEYLGNFTYGDPEDDHVDIHFDDGGTGAQMVDNGDGTGYVVWTPGCENIGNQYTLCLTAVDQCLDSVSCCWVLTVTNNPPVFTSVPASSDTIRVDSSKTYSFTADDPDGDPICSMNIWATLGSISDINPSIPPCQASPVTVTFTYTAPAVDQLTDDTICIMVDDTCEAVVESCFTVHIGNRPPECACTPCPCPCSLEVHKEDAVFDFHATDADGDNLTYQLIVVDPQPFNAPVVTITNSGPGLLDGDITWTPNCIVDKSIWYHFQLIVDDGKGGQDTCDYYAHCYNEPPWVNCPPDSEIHGDHAEYVGDFTYGDPEDDHVDIFFDDGGTGAQMVDNGDGTGYVTWTPGCDNIGNQYTLKLTAMDQCGDRDSCLWVLTVYNNPPSCQLFCPDSVFQGISVIIDFTVDDPDNDWIKSINASVPPGCGSVSVCTPSSGHPTVNGEFIYAPPDAPFTGTCTITLTVKDTCDAENTCECEVAVGGAPFPHVVIPNKVYERFGFGHWDYFEWDVPENDNYIILDDKCPPYNGINPGDWFEIPIILDGFDQYPIGGFELEVEFDYINLTFYGAMRGGLLERRVFQIGVPPGDSTFWSWEYFSYRVLPCTDLHKYKILLFGQADMPDGLLRRGYCLTPYPEGFDEWWYEDTVVYQHSDPPVVDTLTFASLVWLKFRVANNELLRDLKLPVFFEWEHKLSPNPPYVIIQDWDCAENTFSNCEGTMLYVSGNTLQYDPDVCAADTVDARLLFVDGGVHVCSPCTSFTCVRGDINHDAIAYTTADAVLFARYFVEGIIVFIIDRDEQICATDVNADGRTLMLADLVYLIRVILQVAPEIPKLGPSSEVVNMIVYDNTITTECASPIGAILFEFDGAVVPTLLADKMEMINKGNKVLVWSTTGNTITTAEVLSFIGDAELVSVTAVDYDTRELQTSITVKVAPSAFALNPAYPNPFNPFTNLSFTLPEALNYTLKIYNVAGQLVRSYEGMGSAGLNVITWDANDLAGVEVASGIYFYKLTAASFSATRKMVMLK